MACDNVSYRITKGEDLREQGYAGLHTVGRGSNVHRFCWRLDYNPTGDKKRRFTPVWSVKVSPSTPAATASNRARSWTP
ncbi:hypothetical protein ACNKHQ_14775 [Shigella flexneri]